METTQVINNLANTHIIRVITPILPHLDETEKEILSAFLSQRFPGSIQHQDIIEVFKDTPETEIFFDEAYKTFKELMSVYTDKLNANTILYLNEIMDIYGLEDDDCFQELNELIDLIKEKIIPSEIDEKTKEHINDELDVIGNVLQTNSRRTSKENATLALKRLDVIYEKHTNSRDYISSQLAQYGQQIKFIAPDFCAEKVDLSAEHLTLFEMTIRKHRILEN